MLLRRPRGYHSLLLNKKAMVRISISKKVSLGAMVIALSVLCLYAAVILPWSKITCLFLASLFIYVLACEGMYGLSVLCFAASAGAAFLVLPDKTPLYAYCALLGHYGIFRTFAQTHIKDKLIRFILKLAYCDIFVFVSVLIVYFVFDFDFSAVLSTWSWWLLIIVLQLALVGYDLLYSLCVRFYDNVLRNRLLPRR